MFYQTQTAHSRAVATVYSHHSAAREWSRLLLHDVICSQRVTMHFQWGGNLSPVPFTFMTFDPDI